MRPHHSEWPLGARSLTRSLLLCISVRTTPGTGGCRFESNGGQLSARGIFSQENPPEARLIAKGERQEALGWPVWLPVRETPHPAAKPANPPNNARWGPAAAPGPSFRHPRPAAQPATFSPAPGDPKKESELSHSEEPESVRPDAGGWCRTPLSQPSREPRQGLHSHGGSLWVLVPSQTHSHPRHISCGVAGRRDGQAQAGSGRGGQVIPCSAPVLMGIPGGQHLSSAHADTPALSLCWLLHPHRWAPRPPAPPHPAEGTSRKGARQSPPLAFRGREPSVVAVPSRETGLRSPCASGRKAHGQPPPLT